MPAQEGYVKAEWFKDTKAAFQRLDEKKQEKILQACLDEFAEEGFETASTNRIAEKAGIAKGSIFKYFGTKEKMFFAVVNYMLVKYLEAVKKSIPSMPKDILERYMFFMEETLQFMGGDMKVFKAFYRIMSEKSELIRKLRKSWEPLIEPMMEEFFAGANLKNMSISIAEFARFFNWIDGAIDADIYDNITSRTTPEELKEMYRERIVLVAKILKHGIYK
jgi:AcrR family transcriptional regulator